MARCIGRSDLDVPKRENTEHTNKIAITSMSSGHHLEKNIHSVGDFKQQVNYIIK